MERVPGHPGLPLPLRVPGAGPSAQGVDGQGLGADGHRPEVPISRSQADVTCRTAWSTEDNEFVATCDEYPSLSWLAPTSTEALQGLERLLENELGTNVSQQ